MGDWGFLWFSDQITQWKAFLQLCTSKNQIDFVNEQINKLEIKQNEVCNNNKD